MHHAATARPRPRPAARRGWMRWLLVLLLKVAVIFVVVTSLWVLAYRFVPVPYTFTMLGDNFAGRTVTKEWTPLSGIHRNMVRAAIAAEDDRFCQHNGFDFRAIANAAARNAAGGRIRGGSTISQQTAKNAFLWQGGGFFRKGLEAWFTVLIELMWPKSRIMEVYLNIAETGIGTYGVQAGAIRYFQRDADRLTAQQAARIAAVLPLPKSRPGIAPTGYTARYGRSIERRARWVGRDGLDDCV